MLPNRKQTIFFNNELSKAYRELTRDGKKKNNNEENIFGLSGPSGIFVEHDTDYKNTFWRIRVT